jgi:hypothetical protein
VHLRSARDDDPLRAVEGIRRAVGPFRIALSWSSGPPCVLRTPDDSCPAHSRAPPDVTEQSSTSAGLTPPRRHHAISSLRARATMPMRRARGPPAWKRSRYQRVSALVGWKRSHPHASSTAIARHCRFPAFEIPAVVCVAPLWYGAATKPANAPSSRPFRMARQLKISLAKSHAPCQPMPRNCRRRRACSAATPAWRRTAARWSTSQARLCCVSWARCSPSRTRRCWTPGGRARARCPAVLLRLAGHVHDLPHAAFPAGNAQQPREQFASIEPIGLRPARAAWDLHARGVDHHVLHP